MARQKQPESCQRPSNSSSQPYPSPSMSDYDYPPPAQGHNEPYRASSTNSHSSLPSVSSLLILAMDSESQLQQQRPQQQPSQVAVESPLAPSMGQYYHNQGQSLPPPPHHMGVTSDPNQQMRYPLPVPDNRIMSGGRHKKEIKRRTKTGCLTCRKRRIKCDEGHPSCRNCQKSKRECLGYDPIFKAQPGPAAIQPAPSGSPSLQAASTTASPYPAPPQGYMSASNNPPYGPSLSTGMASPGSTTEPYDYAAAIDPALEGAGVSSMQGQSYGGAQGYGQDPSSYAAGRGGASQFSFSLHEQAFSSVKFNKHGQCPTTSLCSNIVDPLLLIAAYTATPGKRIKIDDLFALEGVPPPPLTPAPSMTANLDEMKTIYTTVYAPFIDKFLETRWFQTRGLNHLLQDSALCERFTILISRYTMTYDFHAAAVTRSLEASVIWSIMSLCRQVASTTASSSGQINYLEVNDGVQDASKRLTIFENLVTKQYFDTDVPAQTEITGNGTVFDNQLKYREREFWRLLEKFLTIHDDKEGAAKEIDDTLGACRVILDSRENRDVLYSIAIIRAVGQRVAEFPDRLPPPVNNNEQDNRTKLSVAKKFIESEAAGGGTNQVIQRLCGMAHRSWMLRR